MNHQFCITTLVVFSIMAVSVAPAEMNPADSRWVLDHASRRLSGSRMTRSEFATIARGFATPSEEATWLRSRINARLESPAFEEQLRTRLHELWRFQYASTGVVHEIARSSAASHLFTQVIREDRSWDRLLTEQTVEFLTPPNYMFSFERNLMPRQQAFLDGNLRAFSRDGESEFGDSTAIRNWLEEADVSAGPVRALDQNRGTGRGQTRRYRLDLSGEPNIAGVLTTGNFLERYSSTAVNQNRSRAAAVLRVLLCNDMRPNVDMASPARESQLMQNALGVSFHPTAGGPAYGESDQHASDPSCRACHVILDPIARLFRGSQDGVSPDPVRGELVLVRGSLEQRIPVVGLQGLARAITQQPEYAQCQVQHFWNWFVGSDVPLTPQRKTELVRVFDEVGRRPKPFILHLIESPEFREVSLLGNSEAMSVASQARRLLAQRCDACHTQRAFEPGVPMYQFSTLPWPEGDRLGRAESLVTEANLNGLHSPARMPPRSTEPLSPAERRALTRWLQLGAPDLSGQRQLAPEQVQRFMNGGGQ